MDNLLLKTFEMLLGDEGLHSVTGFPRDAKSKDRVRVTRCKARHGFHVELGRPNYAEREFLKKCKRQGSRPDFMVKRFLT